MSKVKEFTVNRKKWARGRVNGPPALCNSNKNMCCLGFLGIACGISQSQLEMTGLPGNLSVELYDKFPTLKGKRIDWVYFSGVNDDATICDNTREKKLRKLFKEIGIKIHFVGKE